MNPPEDLAGYQNIICGMVNDGDVLVDKITREKHWAGATIGSSIPLFTCDVYRKMECPKHEGQTKWEQGDRSGEYFKTPAQDKAKTDDGGKPPLATMPWKALREVAMVQAYGHTKYGDFYNYKKGMEVTRQLNCTIRHIADYLDGIDIDSESGKSHLAHAACRLLFTLETIIEKTAIDDRYKK